MKSLLLVAAVMLAGCASNSGVIQMGSDTFFVSRQAATPFAGLSGIKGETLKEAGAFCAQRGKTIEVIGEKDSQPPYIAGNYPRTEIRFKCI